MTKLPEKNVLTGNKLPKTTTEEMKRALGELHDYLSELLGEDSADKEMARQTLGIEEAVGMATGNKVDKTELDNRIQMLEEKIMRRAVPVGSVHYFAMTKPPVGYLVADGSAVERKAYPDLFSAIGTLFGDGDGETTFDLPDLIGRFAQGNMTPGTVRNAGLPNIVGGFHLIPTAFSGENYAYGACSYQKSTINVAQSQIPADVGGILELDASRFNPVYGSSNTVQPPALTLLPCIKAFQP